MATQTFGDVRKVLRMIRDDVETDTKEMEGELFTGKVVAENLAYIRAQIGALASSMLIVMDGESEAQPETESV